MQEYWFCVQNCMQQISRADNICCARVSITAAHVHSSLLCLVVSLKEVLNDWPTKPLATFSTSNMLGQSQPSAVSDQSSEAWGKPAHHLRITRPMSVDLSFRLADAEVQPKGLNLGVCYDMTDTVGRINGICDSAGPLHRCFNTYLVWR